MVGSENKKGTIGESGVQCVHERRTCESDPSTALQGDGSREAGWTSQRAFFNRHPDLDCHAVGEHTNPPAKPRQTSHHKSGHPC